jgi:hypothetical protein
MTNLKAKLGGALAIATAFSGVIAPAAFADTTVNISHNSSFSHNGVVVKNIKKTIVGQSNNSKVITGVGAVSNTGGNKASFNNGGNTSITTGNVTNNITVSVGGSSNVANLPDCGCGAADTNVTIDNNGAFSHNHVFVKNKDVTVVGQSNNSFVATGVYVNSNTGNNSASFNNGGTTGITTGNTDTTVNVEVTGGVNVLNP